MRVQRARWWVVLSAVLATAFGAPAARADVIAISPAAFPLGSTLLTFTGLALGTEVNLLTVGGVQFTYSFGPGNVIVGLGPGNTNNITSPDIELRQGANPTGVLTMALPSLQNLVGFGFALLTTTPVPNAVIVSLFNNATPVGALLYGAVPDPLFAGGFAGIQSTLEFNRVQLSFNPGVAAFAVDNIRFSTTTPTVIPEPSTLALVLSGLGVIVALRRRRPRSDTE